MKKHYRILCLLLLGSLLFSCISAGAEKAPDCIGVQIGQTSEWLLAQTPSPQVGSVGGGWLVFGLARSGASVPDGYFDRYFSTLCDTLAKKNGVLSARKYTEYARVVLALIAIGRNPTDVAGFNLTAPFGDYDKTAAQGLPGVAFALIALDSGGYAIPSVPSVSVPATRDAYVRKLLSYEVEGGGFSLSGKGAPDADVTAIALSALARYIDDDHAAASAAARAVSRLSQMQLENGGFASMGAETAESAAQVMVALCEMKIPLDDPRFVKNGHSVLDALLAFALENGGFSHIAGGSASLMASEQALYALAAAERAETGLPSLYDLSDVPSLSVFWDTVNHADRNEIEALAARNILTGYGDGTFLPDKTMSRAEFAAVLVRGLGIPPQKVDVFTDVPADSWYAPSVGAAYSSGLVRGTSANRFSPDGTITVCEAEIMLARAAGSCGLDWETPEWFADAEQITRCAVARQLYRLLDEAGRLS